MSESITLKKHFAGEELENSLLQQIENGELKPGDSILSERKLAKLHNISYMTVRNSIDKLVQKKYLFRKNRKGTFVADTQGPKTSIDQTIVVSTCEEDTTSQLNSPFNWFIMMRAMKGITRGCVDFGLRPIFKNRTEKIFDEKFPNVIIYHPLSLGELDFLQKRNLPFIAVHEIYDEIHDCCLICDRRKAFYKITRHLIELGHRNIVYFGPGMNHLFFRPRFDGYQQAMLESDLKPQRLENPKIEAVDEYYQKVKEYLKDNSAPEALLAGNDFRAIQAIKAFNDFGLRVPDDVAVIGYDGIEEGKSMEPALTTSIEPVEEMAYEAVQFIAEWLQNGKPEKSVIIKDPEFIVRESCGTKLKTTSK